VQEGVARQRPDRERDQEVQHRAVEPLLHQRDDRDSAQAAEADDYDAEGCVEPDCKNKTRKKMKIRSERNIFFSESKNSTGIEEQSTPSALDVLFLDSKQLFDHLVA
jgi:hypothetical protein